MIFLPCFSADSFFRSSKFILLASSFLIDTIESNGHFQLQIIFDNFLFLKKFILFLAALGLHCCTQAFSSCGEQGLLIIVVRRLLIVVASLVVEHGL